MMYIMALGHNANYYLSTYRLTLSQSSHVSSHTHMMNKEQFMLFFGAYVHEEILATLLAFRPVGKLKDFCIPCIRIIRDCKEVGPIDFLQF